MQTGVINNDNMSQVLRQLSQKRKQGVLEITAGESIYRFYFAQGKIVDASDSLKKKELELLERLQEASLISILDPKTFLEEHAEEIDESDLFASIAALSFDGGLDPDERETFELAVEQLVADLLFSVKLGAGAYYEFKVQMVDPDREFLPSFSVGQILLDFVALEGERERFEVLYADGVEYQLSTLCDAPRNNFEERILYYLEDKGPADLKKIRKGSMLSELQFTETFQVLLQDGWIERAAEVDSAASAPALGESMDELLSGFEDSIDSGFAEDGDSPDEGQQELAEDELEEEDFEEEEVSSSGALQARLTILNSTLLNTGRLPWLCSLVFFLCAVCLPLLMWRGVFQFFAD